MFIIDYADAVNYKGLITFRYHIKNKDLSIHINSHPDYPDGIVLYEAEPDFLDFLKEAQVEKYFEDFKNDTGRIRVRRLK